MATVYVGIVNNQIVTEWEVAQPTPEPIYAEIDDSDSRYTDWQNYLAAKDNYGALQTVNITSTGTPSLNGSYNVDLNTRQTMNNQTNALNGNKPTFLNGTTTLNWPDMQGVTHAFTPTTWPPFAQACTLYFEQLHTNYLNIKADHTVAWNPPSQDLTIA